MAMQDEIDRLHTTIENQPLPEQVTHPVEAAVYADKENKVKAFHYKRLDYYEKGRVITLLLFLLLLLWLFG